MAADQVCQEKEAADILRNIVARNSNPMILMYTKVPYSRVITMVLFITAGVHREYLMNQSPPYVGKSKPYLIRRCIISYIYLE